MDTVKIGLLGAGTVGSGVIKVMRENAEEITKKTGAALEIKTVMVHNLNRNHPDITGCNVTDRFEDILEDPEISIVIELIGGIHPAKEYMLRAMQAGKHVVTANKDIVAEYGEELFETAQKNNVDFMFEASVGGGIPIILPLKESLTANRITEIMGIVNGTTNYMLSKMTKEVSCYSDVLKEAQEKGYAEADPTSDVEGLDAARKLAILASIAFNTRINFHDVAVEGMTNIRPEAIVYASQLGYVVKLLAIGRDCGEAGIDVRVHPVFLPKSHPLASVDGVYNAIFIRGNAIGEAMFYGRGAGSLPTASAVVADVINTVNDLRHSAIGRVTCTCYDEKKLCPLDDTVSSYYVRLLVDDEPGVLGTIATTFGNQGVSLLSVIQTRSVGNKAEIVAITHHVRHSAMEDAAKVLSGLHVVSEVRSVIRVENGEEG